MRDAIVNPLQDALGICHRPAARDARIVCLVPSITELVWDLGLGAQLVGRTGFCVRPREALRAVAKVGGTKDVNLEKLRALAPSHVIVNVDENRRETVEALAGFVPHVIVTHPCAPQDNFALYRLLGGIFGRVAEAEALCAGLADALAQAYAAAADLPRERVLYLIWRDPWMTVSAGTYIAATLAAVGWDAVAVASPARYPAFDWAEPAVQAAARVLLSSEPYRFQLKHEAEVTALSGRPARRLDGEWASWYGSRAIAGLRALVRLRRSLHEGVAGA